MYGLDEIKQNNNDAAVKELQLTVANLQLTVVNLTRQLDDKQSTIDSLVKQNASLISQLHP